MSETSSQSGDATLTDNDLNNPDVVTKYRLASDFANHALQTVIAAAKPGAKILDLCKLGDAAITDKTNTVYNKAVVVKGEKVKVEKGVAFPTSISVNNVLANFCPPEGDDTVLAEGDVAKIELAVHIDGYIAGVTHTINVGGAVLEGRKADVVAAAQTALEASLRLLKPGTKSEEIVKMTKKVAETFGVTAVEGVICSNLKRFVIKATKEIPIRPRVDEKVEHFEIEEGEVYSMEFSFSTSEEGKCSGKDGIVTVYRRAVDVSYMLKLKAARQLFSDINTLTPTLPFCMRNHEAKLGASAKLGLKEINEHQLLIPYYSLVDKPTETIATFKTTCLVLSSGVLRLTSADYPAHASTKTVADPDLQQLLAASLKKAKKKKAAAKKDEAAAPK